MKSKTIADSDELIIERVFDAPRQLVWDVWHTPEHIAQWFGPAGFTTRVELMEFRPGGKYRYVMIGPDGTEYPSVGVYIEVDPIDRVVSTDDFGDEYKEVAEDKNLDLPKILRVTILFEDEGGKTKVSIITKHASEDDRIKHEKMGVAQGWEMSFEKLDQYLFAL